MAYGWSDGTIALMANWGGIAQMVFFVPISFLLVRTGARYIGSWSGDTKKDIRCFLMK